MKRAWSNVARAGIALVIGFLASGCSSLGSLGLSGSEADRASLAVADGSHQEIVPFTLEVTDEINDGKKLLVRGRVTPKTSWDPATVVVRLSALADSGEVRTAYFPLGQQPATDISGFAMDASGQVSRVIAGGEPIAFSLEVSSEGLSNYQLELLWGSDAAPVLKKAMEPDGPGFLALRGLEVQLVRSLACNYIPCPAKYEVTGELFNSGGKTVSNVVLGAGFPQDGSGKVAARDERRIEVRNIKLEPGATRPIKLTLDPLPGRESQTPVLRIISFDAE